MQQLPQQSIANFRHLLLLHGLEDLNDAPLIAPRPETFKHLAVLSLPHLPQHLVPILLPASTGTSEQPYPTRPPPNLETTDELSSSSVCLPPLDVERLVIPVLLGPLGVGVRVDARNGGGAPGKPRGPAEARRDGERRLSCGGRGGGGGRGGDAAAPLVGASVARGRGGEEEAQEEAVGRGGGGGGGG